MGLNKQSGNMYPWVTHTWNPIKGKCLHGCIYCYMKRFPLEDIRLDEREFNTDLGRDNIIFIGSSCDIFAEAIPDKWILKVLDHIHKFENTYLFQTKNPYRLNQYPLPNKSIIGTTIESNREYPGISKAPSIQSRVSWMKFYKRKKMVSIEPILDFDIKDFVMILRDIDPNFVSIGADSKDHNLPEPTSDKIVSLISKLEQFTEVKIKSNLKRIMGELECFSSNHII